MVCIIGAMESEAASLAQGGAHEVGRCLAHLAEGVRFP